MLRRPPVPASGEMDAARLPVYTLSSGTSQSGGPVVNRREEDPRRPLQDTRTETAGPNACLPPLAQWGGWLLRW